MSALIVAMLLHVDVSDEKALAKWLDERVKLAKAGTPELVRFPMVHHDDWGVDYPTYFVSVIQESGPNSCPCLNVKFEKGAEEPDTRDPKTLRDNGRVAIVEGKFTGETTKQGEYTLRGFTVLRHRPYRGEGDSTEAKVIATAAQLGEGPKEPLGGAPWLATVDSFDVFDKASEKKAQALLEKVKKAEFGSAEIIDSRGAPLLFCCYEVVIAGKFETQDEATAVMKQLKKKGFSAAGVRRAR